jgi:hypothetical protein
MKRNKLHNEAQNVTAESGVQIELFTVTQTPNLGPTVVLVFSQ